MNAWLIFGIVGFNTVQYLVPLAFHRLVLNRDPAWMSYATYVDLLAVRETIPMYALSVLLLFASGAGVCHRVRRMRALMEAPDLIEYVCLGLPVAFALLWTFNGGKFGTQWWLLAPAIYNLGVIVSYPCRPSARRRPSSLLVWVSGALFASQVASGASNVHGGPPWASTFHQISSWLAFMFGFPLIACLRSHDASPALLSAAALVALFSVTLDLEGYSGAIQPKYFAEFVGHTALLLAFVLGSVRMLE